jgi:hypothetical protein
MVTPLAEHFDTLVFFAQQDQVPLLKELDPPRRAIVLMAILGLVLLGIALVAGAMIGGRWVRRMARSEPKSDFPSKVNENQRLRRRLAKQLPEVESGETIHSERGTDETVAD